MDRKTARTAIIPKKVKYLLRFLAPPFKFVPIRPAMNFENF